ncbi:hypothetical protein ANCCEY_11746 [Ancylostoma ceylanicum]|uniref:Reverse transcriptase domain-containing protein n=1 Tax=Ancylostoma ceylanicum TaxID=53326 RepID=A0A0D6LD34_9BILA|nr:hypothetical protein ANCCEY_11746 [Ancylostoma ceylanicum]
MLNHLRFADDIVLLTHTPQEAERMVRQLGEVGKKVGLQLNAKKTKTTLEDTDEYVYLVRLINMANDLKPELIRRKRAAWAAYNTIRSAVSGIKNQ